MQFIYAPEGADPRKWDFDPARLMSPEIEVIERNTGMPYLEWIEQVGRGSVSAIHGLLFVLLKREAPTLKWGDVQFCMADVAWEYTDDETRSMVEALEGKATTEGLTDDEAEFLVELRAQLPEDTNVPESEVAAPLEG
jgi:hypothetical protein